MRVDYKVALIGQKFGKLTPIVCSGKCPRGNLVWTCKCDCGKETKVQTRHLKRGTTISCGCAIRKRGKENHNWKGYYDISKTYLTRLKIDARHRKIKFNLTEKYLWDLFIKQNKKCVYSGLELSFGERYLDRSKTASLDRIDSSKGYIEGNVQWVHRDVNFMKQDYSNNYFIDLITKIYNNLN
jgi:hypothetical protein